MEMCSFVTGKGQCPYKSKHVYEGENLCDRHLTCIKSREPCSICLDPMSRSHDRIQLVCGHFFHARCLSHCKTPMCPYCRHPMEPSDACRVFTKTKIMPLMERVYALDQPHAVMGLLEKLVHVVERNHSMDEWKMEIMADTLLIMDRCMRACDLVSHEPDNTAQNMMQDVAVMLAALRTHLVDYGSFSGFVVDGADGMLVATSMSPLNH